MVKSFAAFIVFALLGASLVALPGFAPNGEATEVRVLIKADRLPVRIATADCAGQAWPHFATSCLQRPHSTQKVVEARLVTVRH